MANTNSDEIMQTTTVEDLNQLTATQCMLITLRSLMTSDLSFAYMLFSDATQHEIGIRAAKLLNDELEAGDSSLDNEERREYFIHVRTLMGHLDGTEGI